MGIYISYIVYISGLRSLGLTFLVALLLGTFTGLTGYHQELFAPIIDIMPGRSGGKRKVHPSWRIVIVLFMRLYIHMHIWDPRIYICANDQHQWLAQLFFHVQIVIDRLSVKHVKVQPTLMHLIDWWYTITATLWPLRRIQPIVGFSKTLAAWHSSIDLLPEGGRGRQNWWGYWTRRTSEININRILYIYICCLRHLKLEYFVSCVT